MSRSSLGLYTMVAALSLGSACGSPETASFDEENLAELDSLVQPVIGAPPQILAVTPNMASALGTASILITGKNFRPGATVSIGGVNTGYVNVRSSTEISTYVPYKPGAFGRVALEVRHPDGKTATRSDLFYYYSDTMDAARPNRFGTDYNLSAPRGADFNGDGKLDIVSTDSSYSRVDVLLGNGDGTLQDPKLTTLPAYPGDFIAGDWNGDGKRDLAVAQYSRSVINILTGNGDGTFRVGSDVNVYFTNASLVTGDVNGDGKLDIVAGPRSTSGGSHAVLLGKGDGTFTDSGPAMSTIPAGLYALADFNKDGKLDLLLNIYSSSSGTIYVVPGKGDGSFDVAAIKQTAAPSYTYNAAFGDLNGDGVLDLALARSSTVSSATSVMLGKGDGTFHGAVDLGGSGSGNSVAIGDVNGDGKLDIVCGTYSSSEASILSYSYAGNGDGTFAAARGFTSEGLDDLLLTDLDADGKVDIIARPSSDYGVLVLFGNGAGSFYDPKYLPVTTAISAVRIGDLNGDGKADLAVASYDTGTVSILLAGKSVRYQTVRSFAVGRGPTGIELVDLTMDGKIDLVVSNYDSSNVSVLAGSGDGTFAAARNYNTGNSPTSLTIGDFNGDGKPDVATSNFDADSVSVLTNSGGGVLASAKNYAAQKYPAAVASADFNGDGKADLVTANSDSGTVSVHLASATGFNAAKHYTVGKTPTALSVADFNGDGKTDIAVSNTDTNNVSVLLNSGTGIFAASVAYAACTYPTGLFARDLDRDNRMDLMVSCDASPSATLLMGFGDGAFFPSQLRLTKNNSGPAAVDDLDGDGKADFVLAGESTGQLSIVVNRTP